MAIPQDILDHVALHVRRITQFNEEMARLRALGERYGSPGRYEWEYRMGQTQALVEASAARLTELERRAQAQGEDPQALYGGQPRPVVEPWSPEALSWHRPA